MNEELKNICKKKNFHTFWELFEFLMLTGSHEVEALLMSLDIFDGDIWSKVVDINIEGGDFTVDNIGDYDDYEQYETEDVEVVEVVDTDDIIVDVGDETTPVNYDVINVSVYVLTNISNNKFKSIYKSYIQTMKYDEIAQIDNHVKKINLRITSNIMIRLFDEWLEEKNKIRK